MEQVIANIMHKWCDIIKINGLFDYSLFQAFGSGSGVQCKESQAKIKDQGSGATSPFFFPACPLSERLEQANLTWSVALDGTASLYGRDVTVLTLCDDTQNVAEQRTQVES